MFFAFLLLTALVIQFTKQGFHPDPQAWDSQIRTAIKSFCWSALRPLGVYQLWLQTRVLRNSQGCSQLYFMNPLSPICLSFQHCTLLQLCLEQAPCLLLEAAIFTPVVYWSHSSPSVYNIIKTQGTPIPICISLLISDNKIVEIPLFLSAQYS